MKKIALTGTFAFALCSAVPLATAADVGLQQATATFSQSPQGFYGVNFAVDGINDPQRGWAIDPNEGVSQTAVVETVLDVGFAGGSIFTFTLTHSFSVPTHTLGRFRLSVTTDDRASFADGLLSGGDVVANWTVLDPTTALSANGATLSELGDHSILASGTSPFTDTYTVTAATALTGITGFRLEALTDPSLPFGGPGRHTANGNFVLNEFGVSVTAVPEPETYALIMAGLGVIGLAVRRRKQ
jgi:PEP-CTERM motif